VILAAFVTLSLLPGEALAAGKPAGPPKGPPPAGQAQRKARKQKREEKQEKKEEESWVEPILDARFQLSGDFIDASSAEGGDASDSASLTQFGFGRARAGLLAKPSDHFRAKGTLELAPRVLTTIDDGTLVARTLEGVYAHELWMEARFGKKVEGFVRAGEMESHFGLRERFSSPRGFVIAGRDAALSLEERADFVNPEWAGVRVGLEGPKDTFTTSIAVNNGPWYTIDDDLPKDIELEIAGNPVKPLRLEASGTFAPRDDEGKALYGAFSLSAVLEIGPVLVAGEFVGGRATNGATIDGVLADPDSASYDGDPRDFGGYLVAGQYRIQTGGSVDSIALTARWLNWDPDVTDLPIEEDYPNAEGSGAFGFMLEFPKIRGFAVSSGASFSMDIPENIELPISREVAAEARLVF
jgi:hypothetical protein